MANLLEAYSATNSLGWTVVQQDSPNRKVWDNVPLVIVTPSPKAQVAYISFVTTKTVNSYDCYLIDTGDLASNFDDKAQQFFTACLSNFMPQDASMGTAGAYMSRIVPKYDYDRALFPKGYSSTCINVNVYNVNQ